MADVPMGTIISFYGTLQQAQDLQQKHYWICDGQRIIDDSESPMDGRTTPDLRRRFFRGAQSNNAGGTGGQPRVRLEAQTIRSHTTGGFGAPQVNGDPFTHMQGAHSWTTDASIYSEGSWEAQDVDTIPPFFEVVFLIKVR